MGRWTPDNVNATVPRATWMDPNNNKRPSDYYLEDGSYLRMKNISLGYTIPKALTRKVGLEKSVSISQHKIYLPSPPIPDTTPN